MVYERDLDLNLLRVFAVVAETGSVTAAASKLYLTQPAVSAALRRLNEAVGAKLFVRSGRGIVLTSRGARLQSVVRTHLTALTDSVRAGLEFDPRSAKRTVRLGLADAAMSWLLPRLVARVSEEAPGFTFIAVPIQFRTVADAFVRGDLDLAVTVADELPDSIVRMQLFGGSFVVLYDPRTTRLPRSLTKETYLARPHVIVSYNADTRGLLEDLFGVRRNVRVSVASFESVGALVDGSPLLATVPAIVAREILRTRPHLRTRTLPFEIPGTPTELLSLRAAIDDEALAFVRRAILAIAKDVAAAS